jgi:hypothetical protein
MGKARHTTEGTRLRGAGYQQATRSGGVAGQGNDTGEDAPSIGISDAAYYMWRKEYGGQYFWARGFAEAPSKH